MNLNENIRRIKEVMGIISEIQIQNKYFGEGSSKNVYYSSSNPDIVFKVSDYGDLKYEMDIFNKYPDLFCKTYGEIKKLSETVTRTRGNGEKYEDDVYYLSYEKLDTEKYVYFYRNIEQVFEDHDVIDEIEMVVNNEGWVDSKFEFCVLYFAMSPNKNGAKKLLDLMKPFVKQDVPELYNDYIWFIELLYRITGLEEFDSELYWDFNYGNFGYDKNGKIKSLDI